LQIFTKNIVPLDLSRFIKLLEESISKGQITEINLYKIENLLNSYIDEVSKLINVDYYKVNLGVIEEFLIPSETWSNSKTLGLFTVGDLLLFLTYKNLSKTKLFIDIGANLGLHSYVANKLWFKVISFEPDPKTQKNFIDFNSGLNKIVVTNYTFPYVPSRDHIVLVPGAASDHNGDAKFLRFENNNFGNHIKNSKTNVYGKVSEINVKMYDIQPFIQAGTVIKLDAEGYDFKIANRIIKSHKSCSILFCDWRPETREKIVRLVLKSKSAYLNSNNFLLKNVGGIPKNGSNYFVLANF
jgi:FkbM family methyltransferase